MKKQVLDTVNKEETINTVIGKGTFIDGTINVRHSCRIDGTIKGKITSDENIVIGENGFIDGTVVSNKVTVSGKVIGNIYANTSAVFSDRAEFDGELKTIKILIADGAIFNGKCIMLKKPEIESTKK